MQFHSDKLDEKFDKISNDSNAAIETKDGISPEAIALILT